MTDVVAHPLNRLASNVISRLTDVLKEKTFSDVTLVSDDQQPFQAHRCVLSTFSPVLKNILHNNPYSHPLIYLGGRVGFYFFFVSAAFFHERFRLK